MQCSAEPRLQRPTGVVPLAAAMSDAGDDDDGGKPDVFKMAREDKLASRLRDEARASSVAAAAAAPSRTMPVDVPSTVADRLEAAWKNSAQFVAEWQSRAPVPAEDAAPVDTDGLSAVGRLRKTGASSDPMSAKADSASQSVFGWSNLNDKFNDFIDDMNQKKNK